METTVVNIYHKVPYDVYIGRAGKGQDGYFGNPCTQYDRDTNVQQFKKYFFDRLKHDTEFALRVRNLKGKVLGCFCAPKPCHGDIIAEYVNSLPEIKPLKYAVIGSREFDNYEFMEDTLKWYDIREIISGGARGADSLAVKYAKAKGIPFREFLPNWHLHGKSAGFKRNKLIVEAADEVIAFWDGESRGTKHSIGLAEDSGKAVHIFWRVKPPITDIAEIG